MDAGGERKLVVAGGALLAGGLIWLAMGVPGLPGAADGEAAARKETLQVLYRAEGPTDQAEVQKLVAAFKVADRAEIDRLSELAESDDPLVAGNAIGALGRLGEVDADSPLTEKLDDPRPRVRHEVVAALGLSGDTDAARHLVPLLQDADDQTRLLAIQSLAQLGVHEPLDALLQDPATDARTGSFVQAAQQPPRVPKLLATTSGLEEQ